MWWPRTVATAVRSASAARRWGSVIAALQVRGLQCHAERPLRSTIGPPRFHVERPAASARGSGQALPGPPGRDEQGGLLVVEGDENDLVEVDAEQVEAQLSGREP